MILHCLTLRNVGIYGGEHHIDLTPPSSGRPVILIGALNGGGKTTLLGAIQLALYGARAQGIERSRKGYERYLRDLINRNASPEEGASVTLEYERWINGESKIYIIQRNWRVEEGKLRESLRVECNGEPDPVLAAHWDQAIDSYLPARLAHLFFFDGEQIERMADEEAAQDLLSSAFQSLLGLDLVSRLQEDLSVLERRKKAAIRTPEDRARIQILEKEVQGAQEAVDRAEQAVAQLETEVQRKEHELKDSKEEFKSLGGELYAQRDALEAERRRLITERDSVAEQIRELAAGPAPFLAVRDLLDEVAVQVGNETAAHRERIVCEAETKRDSQVLEELRVQLPARAFQVVSDTLERYRPQREFLDTPIILHADEELEGELRELLERVLPATEADIRRLTAEWDRLEDSIEVLDRKLTAVPDADAVVRLHHWIVKLETEIAAAGTRRVELDERKRQADFELRIRQSALSKELDKRADNWGDSEHDRRVLDRIPRLKQTFDQFRAKVVARHAGSLESAILEAFQYLTRKPKLIGAVSINPATCAIKLFDGEKKPLPFNLLSAGERQLLATSILWGLAKVSGRPVPLVIDTPLGRLDSHHRTHIVQRYFPTASHQVVLLSTDEEISGRYFELLKPAVGRKYLITSNTGQQVAVECDTYFSHL